MLHNQKKISTRQITRLYMSLVVIATFTMMIAAFVTYGYQGKEIHVALKNATKSDKSKSPTKTNNTVGISPDISRVPSDRVIKRILNKALPHTCKDCDEKPLKCLKEYEINKILVQDSLYKNQLLIELITGKTIKKSYIVRINLDNNQIIEKGGFVDKKRCRDVVEEDNKTTNEYDIMLNNGDDPESSHYVNTQ